MFFPFLYLGLLAFALITQLSAWLVALRRDDLPRWSRWGHGVIFLLLIPATVLDVGATDPAQSGMLPWGWLLGVLFVASAVLTLRTVGPGWGERLCAWGIALFGVVFGLVYLLRYAAYLGVRLPLPLEGLVIAHAATMCVVSIFLYIFFPVLILEFEPPLTWGRGTMTKHSTDAWSKRPGLWTSWGSVFTRCSRTRSQSSSN